MEINAATYDRDIINGGTQLQVDRYIHPKEKFWKKRIERVLSFLSLQKGDRLLDVGCGVGTFSYSAAKQNIEAVGIDYSPESIKLAKKIAKEEGLAKKLTYILGDAQKLPFPDNSFDKVVAADFVEHLTWPVTIRSVEEMLRVLRPEGKMVVYTPNRYPQTMVVFLMKLQYLVTLRDPRKFTLQSLNHRHIGLKTPLEIIKIFRPLGIKYQVFLFARDLPLPPALKFFWVWICEKLPTRTLLAERILVVATKTAS